ncbi:MAG: Uma2 family endonuclease, partial [Bacteroidetes bacterium]
DLQIQDKMTGENLPADLVNYVLNNEISYFPDLYFMANPSRKHRFITRNSRFHVEKRTIQYGVVVYTENCGMLMIKGNTRKPDLVLVNHKEEITDQYDNILNPLAAFEVLSPSTAHIDLTEKLSEYKEIPSLQTYIIISQNEPKVWQYSRTENNIWLLTELEDMNDFIILDFLPETVYVFLKEIYEDIEF